MLVEVGQPFSSHGAACPDRRTRIFGHLFITDYWLLCHFLYKLCQYCAVICIPNALQCKISSNIIYKVLCKLHCCAECEILHKAVNGKNVFLPLLLMSLKAVLNEMEIPQHTDAWFKYKWWKQATTWAQISFISKHCLLILLVLSNGHLCISLPNNETGFYYCWTYWHFSSNSWRENRCTVYLVGKGMADTTPLYFTIIELTHHLQSLIVSLHCVC